MIWTADWLRYCAGLVTEIKGETFSQGTRHLNLTRRQPFGVVAKINPFNHPFRFCAEKAAAPLAAGNTVVIKGSRTGTAFKLPPWRTMRGDISFWRCQYHRGRRPRRVRVGASSRRAADRLRWFSADGSSYRSGGAADLKRVSLELGGKNPIVIFPDADPKKAAVAAIKGMNMNRQGQSCSSTSRVFVHRSLHDDVVAELVALAEAPPVGPPWLKENEVGPIVSQRQFDRVMGFIKSAKEEGAQLLTGGRKPRDPALSDGLFIAPTVFDQVTPAMRIGREEIFGPVMSVMTWDNYEDMLAKVNGLEYGLTAAIVTNDLSRAMETAERIEAGYIWINSNGRYMGAPYGGWKQSGIGEEECFGELLSYTQVKNINMRW